MEMEELRFMNNDIPVQVLSRLSTKNLHMLKFVSKEWQSLISDRSFIRLQLKKTEAVSGFFFQGRFQWCDWDIIQMSYIPIETKNTQTHSTVLNFLPESAVILASCNGLICCRSIFPSPAPVIYVCNPLNKEWISVKWIHPPKRTSVALVFDPLQFLKCDASTNFKIVTVSQTESETEECKFLFDIYSSKTGKWRKSGEICQCKHNLYKNESIFVDGSLYWLTDGDEILMFDPELELSWLINIPLPVIEFHSIPEMCIGESKGKLHYILLSGDGLQLWVLQDHFASQWDPIYTIPLDELERETTPFLYQIAERLASCTTIDMFHWMELLAFKDGILLARVLTEVYSYNFETRKMEKLCDVSDLGPNAMRCPRVVPYTMSLVPVGML